MKKNFLIYFLLSLLSMLFFVSCGSDDPAAPASVASSVATSFPSGLAVSAAFISSAASDPLPDQALEKNPHLKAPTISSSGSMATKTAAIATVLAAATDAACQITLPTVTGAETASPSCYGPMLDYKNHINSSVGDADATFDPMVQNNASEDDGRLPTLDLGLWVATDTTTSHACTAAKLNSLVTSVGEKVDYGLLIGASLNCVMTRAGTALPAISASVDVTTLLDTAIAVNNPTVDVSSATLERLANVGTNAVYLYTIVTRDASDNSKANTLYIKHMPTATDNSTYLGKMYSLMTGLTGGVGNSYAYSILYEKTATNINYKMLGANYTNGASATVANLLGTNGDLQINATTSTIIQGNITQFIANLSSSNGTGNVSYGWQAGVNDDKTRVFNAYTELQATLTEGCGFFGYGSNFNFNTSSIPTNAISTFICNWAGPGNNHTGLTGKAQKQCVLENSTTHKFDTVTANQKITYAPTNSCDYDGVSANAATGNFNWGTSTASGNNDFTTWGANFDHATNKHAAVTNDLVTLASDTEYASYTTPTAPTDTLP